jgi:SAM-dependent methyltransferase
VTVIEEGTGRERARWSRFWSGRREPEEFYPPTKRILEHLLRYAPPGARVLEVGAGSGRDSAALARRGARVVLLDSSAAALDLADRNPGGFRGRSLVLGDAVASPFIDGIFDVVFHQGLMEHFRDPGMLLRENRRLLKPEGILLVDVPQTFHPWTLLKKPFIAMGHWFAGWETQYTPSALEHTARSAGFEILTTYGDWMNPSLAYRLARQALGVVGLRIPQVPPRLPGLHPLRRLVHDALLRRRFALYTVSTIGIVSRKVSD